jgi:Leu/Phe-tRNA-protein transferase
MVAHLGTLTWPEDVQVAPLWYPRDKIIILVPGSQPLSQTLARFCSLYTFKVNVDSAAFNVLQ